MKKNYTNKGNTFNQPALILSDDKLQSVLEILDTQRNYCLSALSNNQVTQTAYYQGMKDMVDFMLLSNGTQKGIVCYNDFVGTHYIYTND